MPPVQYGDVDPDVHKKKGAHGQYISKVTSSMNQHPIQKEKSEIIHKNPNLSNFDRQGHDYHSKKQPSGPSDTLELSEASKSDLNLRLAMNSSGRVEQNSKRNSEPGVKSPPSASADDLSPRDDIGEERLKSGSEDIRRLSLNMRMTTPTRLNQAEQVTNNALFCQQSEPPITNNSTTNPLKRLETAPKKSDICSSLHSTELGRTAKFGNSENIEAKLAEEKAKVQQERMQKQFMQKQIEMQEQQLKFQEALLSQMYKFQEETVKKVKQELKDEQVDYHKGQKENQNEKKEIEMQMPEPEKRIA